MRKQLLAAVLLMSVSLTAGAAPPKAELHGLSAVTPTPTKPVPPMGFTVSVGPVTLPKAVDRPELVLTVEPGKLEVQQLHRWANPLTSEIARVVAEDLGQLFGRDRVWPYQAASREADYRVQIDVQRFDSGPGPMVAIDIRWIVRRGPEGAKQTGRSIVRKGVRASGFEGIVAAHNDALDVMSRDIAEVLATMDREPH